MTWESPHGLEHSAKRRLDPFHHQMPRGRGRGRNPNLTRGTSRRGNLSESQPAGAASRTNSSTIRTNNSLRRSARLAGNLAATEDSMADVARRTPSAVRSRAVDADFSRDRSRPRARRTRTNDEPSAQRYREPATHQASPHHFFSHPSSSLDTDPNYTMDVIVQPPPTALLGTALQPPVTIRLRSLSLPASDDSGTTNLLAVATLTSDSTGSSTDPTALLAGRVFDSIHPFAEDDQGVGYVSFPDLAICGEGTWRIRVTLIRIRTPAGESAVSSRGGSSVQVVESDPVVVERGSGVGREAGKRTLAIF